jgi:hypothetical protein
MQRFVTTIITLLFHFSVVFAQMPQIQTPKTATLGGFGTQNVYSNPQPQNRTQGYLHTSPQTQQRNQALIQEVEQYQQRGQNNLPKDILDDIAQMENAQKYENPAEAYKNLAYHFPPNSAKGVIFYESALQKFESMLSGKEPLNLQKAVYWVENAYYENTLPYQDFTASLKEMAQLIQPLVKTPKTDMNKNLAIYSFMTDTLQFTLPTGKKASHLPFVYDFEDYKGQKDYSKMFVTKVMVTNSGQCHSLPLLYLILAEELKANAWLSYAPNHTFIKFVVNGKIQNYETTNGHLISDALVMQSGFIRSEALANKTYLDTLNKQQLIAHCLMDLGMGYQHKYGFDYFSLRCVELVLKYYPHNVTALMTKSNYYNTLLQYVAQQSKEKRLPHVNMQDIPQVMEIYHKMKQVQQELENIGFAEMPEEMYQNWLSSVKKEAEKQAKTKK